MANPAVIPISVHKGHPIRIKRGRMTILSPQEMLDLLKAARKRSHAGLGNDPAGV
jgi:hypothetical protein